MGLKPLKRGHFSRFVGSVNCSSLHVPAYVVHGAYSNVQTYLARLNPFWRLEYLAGRGNSAAREGCLRLSAWCVSGEWEAEAIPLWRLRGGHATQAPTCRAGSPEHLGRWLPVVRDGPSSTTSLPDSNLNLRLDVLYLHEPPPSSCSPQQDVVESGSSPPRARTCSTSS